MSPCQSCGSKHYLKKVLSLGYLPPPNDYRPLNYLPRPQNWMPTELLLCTQCDLVQLEYQAQPASVFPASYPYTSGTTKQLRDNFADLAEEATGLIPLDPTDLVVDIGSNDGTLLSNFAKRNIPVLGIEPTDIAKLAIANGIPTRQSYFMPHVANDIIGQRGQAKIVTCANCFAHIPNVHLVIDGILNLLTPDGVFISESTYLIDTINKLQYDTIYHEHLRYYSLNSLNNLLKSRGLEVFHVKFIPTHGGSIRVYASRPGWYPIQDSVGWIANELKGPDLADRLETFQHRVTMSKLRLLETLYDRKLRGDRIVGISAPSRAATVINYCGLDESIIDYVCEVPLSLKINKYMPGTNIPVLHEYEMFKETAPEVAILFSWHLAGELIPKMRSKGYSGEFIMPCAEGGGQRYVAVA